MHCDTLLCKYKTTAAVKNQIFKVEWWWSCNFSLPSSSQSSSGNASNQRIQEICGQKSPENATLDAQNSTLVLRKTGLGAVVDNDLVRTPYFKVMSRQLIITLSTVLKGKWQKMTKDDQRWGDKRQKTVVMEQKVCCSFFFAFSDMSKDIISSSWQKILCLLESVISTAFVF